ncbi:hypothetical protein G7Y89_g180 [Cudoniella acicularis]|uniref:DUF1740-domain-containing protein n=1 Tax=Cudoniella acicularis TaxID=354080 RepID=A0A8H4W856_9HELO|nr:hypothetical protein G7Y89_g180 [Cudoniella acicularis]
MSESKTAVPKFGSFRPKPTPPGLPPLSNESEKKQASKSRHRPRDDDSKRGHQHHRRHKEKDQELIKAEPVVPRVRDRSPDIFVIDREGDEKNLVYGSIHRYSVPAFHRSGAGGVLGVPSNIKIDRDFRDDKGIILWDWRENRSSHREKYAFSKVERERPRLLRIRPEAVHGHDGVDANFIPLSFTIGKKRKRAGTNSDSESDEIHYRSIHGKKKTKDQPEDDAFQYATASESSDVEVEGINTSAAEGRQRNVDLSRRVEQSPHDIDAWLALIEQQDFLLRGEDDHRKITNAELRSTADIKIHMYEKALAQAKTLKDRERLLLGLMSEGSTVWETKAQSDRWKQISQDNIDSLRLWTSYLNFKQATFTTFRYEEVRDIFIARIKLLLSRIYSTGAEANSAFNTSLYQQLLYVLLRATILIRESGYSELAVAIWQGLLEINFCGPEQTHSREDQTRLFSEFWESEVARIGDDGAKGWRSYMNNEQGSEPSATIADKTGDSLDNTVLFKSWAVAERARSEVSFIPATTMDEVVEDDPFRVILFSDIEAFLVNLPPGTVDLHGLLIDAFLIFCRLPTMAGYETGSNHAWLADSFVRGELLDLNPAAIKRQYCSHVNSESEEVNICSVFDTPSPNYRNSPDTMFSTIHWFRAGSAWRDSLVGDHTSASYRWVRNTLKQLLQSHFRESLAEYYLSFEWRNEPDSIKKVAKSLLKQHPSNLKLYNAYGMIEWARGNKDVSNGVFSAALNMSIAMEESKNRESTMLWKSWIWTSLEDMDKQSALQRLLSVSESVVTTNISTVLSPAILLKTKQHLISNRDYRLTSGDFLVAIAYGDLSALFEYLTSNMSFETQSAAQGDITSALASYTNLSKSLVDRGLGKSTPHELLLQSAGRLLYHHARVGPFRPALLREHLSRFLNLFPQNTIFLSLYTWNESRLRIDNRVRSILLSTVLTAENDTLSSRLFAIHYEMTHGTIHSVRSTFEHAVASPSSKSSAGLWKLYILFCLETPQFRPQAKDTWHRALRACPWAKELYILGFETMCETMSFLELKRTWRVMGEKELRVHVDLEEKFEDMKDLELEGKEHKRLGQR